MTLPLQLRPKRARKWVDDLADRGADGIKFIGAPPDVFQAALDEAKRRHLGTAATTRKPSWPAQTRSTPPAGASTSMEHWYGLPEALFDSPHRAGFPR